MRILLWMVVVTVAAATLVLWLAQRRWHAATMDLEHALEAAAAPGSIPAYSEAELEGLPAPVARYFRAVLRDGQPIVKRARITWEGEFNLGKPGRDKWVAFTAQQRVVPSAPGFVWNARMAMAPGMPVFVRDGFVAGAGSMRGAVLGLVTVVAVEGTPQIAAAALQRYLGEAAWVPTALLPSQGVRWSAIDDSGARATITAGPTPTSLEFRFGPDGLIASVFAPDRIFDDGKSAPVPRPWTARILRYATYHGMPLPAEAVTEWQLPTGAYQYWRGKLMSIEFDDASP